MDVIYFCCAPWLTNCWKRKTRYNSQLSSNYSFIWDHLRLNFYFWILLISWKRLALLTNWLIVFFLFASCSRILPSYACWKAPKFRAICSVLMTNEQGGVFIMPYLHLHCASVYTEKLAWYKKFSMQASCFGR